MRSFLIKSNNYRPGNLGIYNYQVNIDENSGSVTLLTNVGEYILGGNGDIKLTNYYTKEEIDNIIIDLESGEIDLTRYYTKEQIDDLLDNIETGNVDLTNYFTKTEVEEYVDTQTVGYVDMATLDTITDNKISNATLDLVEKEPFNNLTSKVNTLEDRVNNIDTGDIDLSEYAKMEDIEGFITEADVDSKINDIVVDLTPIEESLDNKVDKVDNKGLSTNDFIASDYYNRGEVDDLISNVEVDLTGYATETYVQTEIGNIEFPTVDLEPYATKAEIDTKLEGYPTTSVVEGMIDEITAGDIDLAGYYNKVEVDTKLLLKVDNVEGKDLSSNDFTDLYKESLDGLSDALVSKADKIETNLDIERLDNKIDSNTTILAQKANQNTTYTKTEVDGLIPSLVGYATEEYVDNAINDIDIPSITGLVTEDNLNTALRDKIDNTYKAEVTTEINNAIVGLKIDTYAKIDSLDAKLDTTEFEAYKANMVTSLSDLDGRIDNLSSVQITTVDVLPETGKANIIYLIPKNGENPTNNIKDEYIWILEGASGRFELIGTTEIDLSNYYDNTEVDTQLNLKADKSTTYTKTEVDNLVSNVEVDLTGYATETYVDDAINNIDIPTTDLSNYYTKTETYTKAETSALIDSVIAGEIDLTNYYTKTESDNAITTAITDLDLDLDNKLLNKVDNSELDLYTTTDNLNKDLVGLPNVDNTSDLNKPVSTATQAALDSKADSVHTHAIGNITNLQDTLDSKASLTHTHTVGEITDLTKASIGLSNVDNTSDLNKPVSTATQEALNSKANSEHTHIISNIDGLQDILASKLDSDALGEYSTITQMNDAITLAIGDITKVTLELVDELPVTGVANIIYLVPNNGLGDNIKDEYIWINNAWEAIGTTEVDLSNYYTKTQVDGVLNTKVNKDGDKVLSTNDYTTAEKNKLENLDNTKDADKPISIATQAALNLKANIADVASDISSSIAALGIEQYETTTSVDSKLSNKANSEHTHTISEITDLISTLSDKVDKVEGKGLSTNDFISTEYLTKTEVETGLGLKANVEHTHTVEHITDLTKASIGLSNVDNTSDLNKPVSTATQVALDSKADSGHTHTISEIEGIQDALNLKANQETTYTKDEVDTRIAENSGGTTYHMMIAGGTHTFGSERENSIILTNSTTDTTIIIPSASENTNYIVRNIHPTGRVFFIADTDATIHASSTGLVDDQYVISGYGMMSVIVYGTDIILTGGI